MKLDEIIGKVKNALNTFYKNDSFLIQKKLCERCLVHRLAVCLENERFPGYFIDCEYNKSHLNSKNSELKRLSNPNGNFVDIIITKRDSSYQNDLICFEIKRWDNYHGRDKDRDNLIILTKGDRFGYDCGFYIILGKKEKTKIEVYIKGNKIDEFKLVNENET